MQGRACASVSAEYEAPARDARTAETMWRCRCASHLARAWGAFSGRRVVWGELSVAPVRTARGGGGRSERWAAPKVFIVVSLSSRPVAVVSRPDWSVVRARRAFHSGGPSLSAGWHWLSGILVCSLGKAQTRQPTCASLRIKSHLCEPTTMQSMLLLFACSATALLPAPARQHRARGVMRMGWGLCGNQPVRRVHPTILHVISRR